MGGCRLGGGGGLRATPKGGWGWLAAIHGPWVAAWPPQTTFGGGSQATPSLQGVAANLLFLKKKIN
jgi:hypothetical protein